MATELNLAAAIFDITVTPGNDVSFSFSAPVNMTGWALKWSLWLANDNADGPTGDPIQEATGSPSLILTAAATSLIAILIPGSATTDRVDQILWGRFWRTDTGSVRTYAEGWIRPVRSKVN